MWLNTMKLESYHKHYTCFQTFTYMFIVIVVYGRTLYVLITVSGVNFRLAFYGSIVSQHSQVITCVEYVKYLNN